MSDASKTDRQEARCPVEKVDTKDTSTDVHKNAGEKCIEDRNTESEPAKEGDVPEKKESRQAQDNASEPASQLQQKKEDTEESQDDQKRPLEPVKKRPSQLSTLASNTRKKRKSRLADMSAAATAQPAKLNTLEKSKLDWETYKGTVPATSSTETMTDAERDELESQTRGGGSGLSDVKGYLHRKEFLDRVHNRLDAQEYDAHLS